MIWLRVVGGPYPELLGRIVKEGVQPSALRTTELRAVVDPVTDQAYVLTTVEFIPCKPTATERRDLLLLRLL